MNLKWLPNALTVARIAAAPVVAWLIWVAGGHGVLSPSAAMSQAAILFSLAAITDFLDGALARALKAQSPLGATLDLWADKLLVALPLLALLPYAPVTALSGLVSLTLRDLVIMRLRDVKSGHNLAATGLAKVKTVIVMVGMAAVMFGVAVGFQPLWQIGLALFGLGCALSLYTGYQYVRAAFSKPTP